MKYDMMRVLFSAEKLTGKLNLTRKLKDLNK